MSRQRTAVLPCGCAYYLDREEWAELCPPHGTEHEGLHARAMEDCGRGEAPRESECVNGGASARGLGRESPPAGTKATATARGTGAPPTDGDDTSPCAMIS